MKKRILYRKVFRTGQDRMLHDMGCTAVILRWGGKDKGKKIFGIIVLYMIDPAARFLMYIAEACGIELIQTIGI